jgi:hypothetical protein
LLFLYKRVTKNKTKKKEWRERGLLETLPFIYFVLFFSVELLSMRDTVSEREFLVCLQEQMKFEGISAAFKRSDAADFMFLFWLSSDRKRREGRFLGLLLSFFSLSHGLSLSRSDSLCLSARESKGKNGKKGEQRRKKKE